MDTLVDLLDSVDGDRTDTVLIAGERAYDGRRFVKSVYKTGNYLRHCGVHEGARVEIIPVAVPETMFGILGTMLLEGTVSFDVGGPTDPAARLGPTDGLDGATIPPGCTAIGYGTPPEDPSWAYFEREIWSENPFFPDVELDPDRPVIETATGPSSFRALLERAHIASEKLTAEDTVALRAAIDGPGVIAAGIVGPLLAGATVLLPEGSQTGSVAVTSESGPEARTIDPGSIED